MVSGARWSPCSTGRAGTGWPRVPAPRPEPTRGVRHPWLRHPQDVFLGGVPLTRVLDPGDLGPGRFYQDFRTNRLYLRDNPDGRIVEQAYAPSILWSAARGVTVRVLVVEKRPTRRSVRPSTTKWRRLVIEDNEVRYNHGVGIRVTARPCAATSSTTTASSA